MSARFGLMRWRAWLTVTLTVLCALALAIVVWRIFDLGSRVGGDRSRLVRERVAIGAARRLVAGLVALVEYRTAVGLDAGPTILAAKARPVQVQIDTFSRRFAHGRLAVFGVTPQWTQLARTWTTSLGQSGSKRLSTLDKTVLDWTNVFSKLQDASGLTYDSNHVAQDLADAVLNGVIPNLAMTEHARMYTLIAIRENGLDLATRLHFSSLLDGITAITDLSPDNVVPSLQTLQKELPTHRAQLARSIALTHLLQKQGKAYAEHLRFSVVLVDHPKESVVQIDASAAALHATTLATFTSLATSLDDSLLHRERLQNQRDAYWYVAALLAALLMLGAMLLVAQFVAKRDRHALLEAQRESERLGTSLARQRAEEALRLSEAQFRAVFERASIGIAILDRIGVLVDANAAFRGVFGQEATAITNARPEEFAALMRGETNDFESELHVLTPAGSEAWVDTAVSLVRDEAREPRFAVCTFRDLTALRASERRMMHDKTHDALTGLPNRPEFEEILRRRFADADALLESFYAVLVVDLDRFKDVNESLGHDAGDFVLTQVAQRIRAAVDAQDVVARLGSDEFAVLVRALGDVLHVESVAKRILTTLARPIIVRERSIFVSACIGIAVASSRYERAEDVMRDAAIAMQHAKTGGSGRHEVFDSNMRSRAQRRLQRSSDLHLALQRGEFRLLYQPIVELESNRLVGCEALIRWDHPTEGLLNPHEFIALAEQMGMAMAVGKFVLDAACKQIADWKKVNGGVPLHMNVNVSVAELNDPEFERNLNDTLARHRVDPTDLTLEITENAVLDEKSRGHAMIERARQAGFPICIDDFGTGYSSLRYLQQYRVDIIKIDRGFVSGLDGELASEPIVRTLVSLAQDFNVRIVAEGVETNQQSQQLREIGCRFGQGFLFARPISAQELEQRYPEAFLRGGELAAG